MQHVTLGSGVGLPCFSCLSHLHCCCLHMKAWHAKCRPGPCMVLGRPPADKLARSTRTQAAGAPPFAVRVRPAPSRNGFVRGCRRRPRHRRRACWTLYRPDTPRSKEFLPRLACQAPTRAAAQAWMLLQACAAAPAAQAVGASWRPGRTGRRGRRAAVPGRPARRHKNSYSPATQAGLTKQSTPSGPKTRLAADRKKRYSRAGPRTS